MTDTPKHSVSVAGVVTDEYGRVLVIQRRDNAHWEPPGGILELDESFEAGAAREVQEETGVDVTVRQLTGIYKNLERGIVAIVFRCDARSTPKSQTSEAQLVSWVSPGEVIEKMTPAYAVRILDALRTDGPFYRSHDGTNLVE